MHQYVNAIYCKDEATKPCCRKCNWIAIMIFSAITNSNWRHGNPRISSS